MATNPYAPPKSTVADRVSDALPMPKPRQIRWAAFLLWTSLALGVVNLALQKASGAQSPEGGALEWVVSLVVVLIYVLFTVLISAGRNWARIVFLILFVIGAIPYFFFLNQIFAQSIAAGTIGLSQELLQFGALLLIFMKPGSVWFRRVT